MLIKNHNFNKKLALRLPNPSKGFTLIEIMIAMTLFTAIMIMGTGAVLQTNAVHKKTQIIRSITDNLNFVMEDMARNIRLGGNFQCPSGSIPITPSPPTPSDCTSGATSIAFQAVDGSVIVYGVTLSGSLYSISKSKAGSALTTLTPTEVQISLAKSGFSVIGSAPFPDLAQPRVIIRLSGTVTYGTLTSAFNLETTVSQRLLDI